MQEITPTRSVLLELRDERRAMEEGYYFLDEKRLVLAAQIIRELNHYESENNKYEILRKEAADSLKAAILRHGLEGLQVYPVTDIDWKPLLLDERSVLGLVLHDVTLEYETPNEVTSAACNPSPEAEYCHIVFAKLVVNAATLAGITRNLQRLHEEYQKTAKRARALEDILLPEIDTQLEEIEASLEELEREEVTRVRYSSGRNLQI